MRYPLDVISFQVITILTQLNIYRSFRKHNHVITMIEKNNDTLRLSIVVN